MIALSMSAAVAITCQSVLELMLVVPLNGKYFLSVIR